MGVTLVAALLLGLGAANAAASPPGPRLAVVKLREPEWAQLLTVDPAGGAQESLAASSLWKATKEVYPWSAPSWSPDGTRIAFTVLNEQFPDFGSTGTSLAWISADGGAVTRIPDTANGFEPRFSPDGRTVAFAKQRDEHLEIADGGEQEFFGSAIWLADLATGRSRPLTPWRNGSFAFPSSFSPDGSRLAFSRRIKHGQPEAAELDLASGKITVLEPHAYEPVYSPDGQSLAFLRGRFKEVTRHFHKHGRLSLSARMTDIFVRDPLGGVRRVTDTPRAAEEAPRWDPSGQRFAYTEWRPFDYGSESALVQEAVGFGFGKSVRTINVDGTCPTTLLSGLDSMPYAAVWQPGPGRGAGPTAC